MPADRYEWSAASQQGLIFADSHSFQGPSGNLALFAHEAAHAWWGNLVGAKGLGAAVCSESMAQYGAVLAFEGVLGVEAATEFLRFGAPGNDPAQCARGDALPLLEVLALRALLLVGHRRTTDSLDHQAIRRGCIPQGVASVYAYRNPKGGPPWNTCTAGDRICTGSGSSPSSS